MINYLLGWFKYCFFKRVSLLSIVDKNSIIPREATINAFTHVVNSSVGKYSYIGRHTEVINCRIGKYCSVSVHCYIGLEKHTIDYISTSPIFTEKHNGTGFQWVDKDIVSPYVETIIGNDVWIGSNVLISGGVKIGDGAIIGAGAVVVKDVEPYSIVGGVPARIIRKRFSDEIIDRLLLIRWWDMQEDILRKNLVFFQEKAIGCELLNELNRLNK